MKKSPSKVAQKAPLSRLKVAQKVQKKGPKKGKTIVKCPDDPNVACREFMKKSVYGWQSWMLDANSAYKACCDKNGPKVPLPPDTDCTDEEECKDVCKLFRAWAKGIRKWAKDFTDDVDKCFPTWQPDKSLLPSVPTGACVECSQLCSQIRDFHIQLGKWGYDVRYPLNEICPTPPERVPEPPPPPFE